MILSGAVFLLFITTACTKKYTCAEAPFKCPSCSSSATEYIDIPWNVVDMSLPQACYLTLKPARVNRITDSGKPWIDMQGMAAEYKMLTENNIQYNNLLEACLDALKKAAAANLSARVKYCTDRSMFYSGKRGVCVRKSDQGQ